MKTHPQNASLVKLALFFAGVVMVFGGTVLAVPGDLDLTFGGTGKVTTDFGSDNEVGQSVAVQADGKIVVAGESYTSIGTGDFALARYNTNGSLDTSFNGTGKVTTDFFGGTDSGNGVAIQGDGKIVVAGRSYNGGNGDFGLARYNTNGSLDTSFNGTGKVTTDFGGGPDYAFCVVVQSDQRIVVAGQSQIAGKWDFAVARYNTDGSLDTSFNGTGKVTTAFRSGTDIGLGVALQDDGKVVVAGASLGVESTSADFALVRYNADGTLDETFNGSGKVTTDFGGDTDRGYGVAIQGDGKIVVGGSASLPGNERFALARYNANGSLDTSFNGTGKVTTLIGSGCSGRGLAVQSDGKTVMEGICSIGGKLESALARYNTDGTLDLTFNGTGKVTTDFGGDEVIVCLGLALQSDDKIVLAGQSYLGIHPYYPNDFAVLRYNGGIDTDEDGIIDRFETGTGIYVSPEDTGTSPTNPDTDGDGLSDGAEVNTYHCNPNIPDTDGDGFDDGFEVSTGFSPTSAASTPDAWSTILTAVEYRFAAADGISYRIEASTDLENWTTIETDIIGAGGVVTRFYSTEGQPKRYFRSRRN